MKIRNENKKSWKEDEAKESYEDLLKQLYDNIYGADIKEVPLSAGQYILADRSQLGLIYQRLTTIEHVFEKERQEILAQAKMEAENIIQQAKLKSFALMDDALDSDSKELETVRIVKNLASENLMYLYKQMKKQTQINIETLISVEKGLQNNLEELEVYKG